MRNYFAPGAVLFSTLVSFIPPYGPLQYSHSLSAAFLTEEKVEAQLGTEQPNATSFLNKATCRAVPVCSWRPPWLLCLDTGPTVRDYRWKLYYMIVVPATKSGGWF